MHRITAPIFTFLLLPFLTSYAAANWQEDISGAELATAAQLMDEASAEQQKGNNWSALRIYRDIAKDYSGTQLAPEALYRSGLIYAERHQFEKANSAFNEVISLYPNYSKFNQVISSQYTIATALMEGERPYYWGIIPGFRNTGAAIAIYEDLVKNAPFSEYAPLALMNIALTAQQQKEPEVAIDALDRLVNVYPDSFIASDGYLQLAATYSSLVAGAWYDQGATRDAIGYYQDYLLLYPDSADAAIAEERLNEMRNTLARSKYLLGDFYYRYRNNHRAALIFYNEAISIDPNSDTAAEAQKYIEQIQEGILAPKTPYDVLFGRYAPPSDSSYDDQTKIDQLSSEAFSEETAIDALSVPMPVNEEQPAPPASSPSTEEKPIPVEKAPTQVTPNARTRR